MMVLEEQDQAERQRAEQFIAETPRINGVDSVRVELGEDSTGHPAMWLVFHLERNLNVDYDWARRFNEYAAVIQTKILHNDPKRFPYTRLEHAA